jgi:hypothetical protein
MTRSNVYCAPVVVLGEAVGITRVVQYDKKIKPVRRRRRRGGGSGGVRAPSF